MNDQSVSTLALAATMPSVVATPRPAYEAGQRSFITGLTLKDAKGRVVATDGRLTVGRSSGDVL